MGSDPKTEAGRRGVGRDPGLFWRTIPAPTRATLDAMSEKLGVSGPTLAAAILAWEAISKLDRNERAKAIAVVVGLSQRSGS